MQTHQVAAGRGWGWIRDGWDIFLKNPLIWIALVVIYMVIAVVMSLIPIIGGLAYALIAPALVGGMLYGAQRLEGGDELEIAHLFQAFRDKPLTAPMLTLGAISLAGSLVIGLFGGGLMMGAMVGAGMTETGTPVTMNTALGGGLIALVVVLALAVILFAMLFYAVPLTMFRAAKPVDAVKASLNACLVNWLPLLVFGLIYTVLSVLAAIPFMLGFLVLGPVTVAALYRSYREVFGAPETGVATMEME